MSSLTSRKLGRHIIKRKLQVLAAAAVYEVLVSFTYINLISPVFSYDGFVYNPLDVDKMVFIHLLALVPALWMAREVTQPSHVIEWVLFLTVYIPATIFPHYIFPQSYSPLVDFDLVLLVSFALASFVSRLPMLKLEPKGLREPTFLVLLYALTAILAVTISFGTGFNFKLASVSKVYDVRAQFTQAAVHSQFLGYLLPWLGQAVAPLLFALGLVRKEKGPIFVGLAMSTLAYSVTAFKTVLFSPFFLVGIKKMLELSKRRSGLMLPIWFSAAVLLCIGLDLVIGFPIFSALFLHRAIVTPGAVTGYYYEFFRNHPFEMLAHSIFRAFLHSPYRHGPSFVIANVYWPNRPDMEANANIWATAYADFGFAGMIVFSLLLGLVLKAFDTVSEDLDLGFSCMLAVFPAMVLANTALLTSLLTHGIGLVMLLLLLVPRRHLSSARLPVISPQVARA